MDRLKIKLRKLINRFDLSDNLFELAEAQKIITKILEIENFPIKKYNETKI